MIDMQEVPDLPLPATETPEVEVVFDGPARGRLGGP